MVRVNASVFQQLICEQLHRPHVFIAAKQFQRKLTGKLFAMTGPLEVGPASLLRLFFRNTTNNAGDISRAGKDRILQKKLFAFFDGGGIGDYSCIRCQNNPAEAFVVWLNRYNVEVFAREEAISRYRSTSYVNGNPFEISHRTGPHVRFVGHSGSDQRRRLVGRTVLHCLSSRTGDYAGLEWQAVRAQAFEARRSFSAAKSITFVRLNMSSLLGASVMVGM